MDRRLTETRTENGVRQFRRIGDEGWLTFDAPEVGASPMMSAIQRLADYEDAEEQGRLVRLPCKIGDIVYFLHGNVAERSEVTAYYISETRTEFLFTKTEVYSSYYVSVEEMSKTVFRTCAEAEEALQAMRDALGGNGGAAP